MSNTLPDRSREIIDQRIRSLVEAALPNGAGALSASRLTTLLENVSVVAFREGEGYALSSLLTVADVAERIGVTERRVRAIAQDRHERFGVGWKVPGTNGVWLFRERELDALKPGEPGRPRKNTSGGDSSD